MFDLHFIRTLEEGWVLEEGLSEGFEIPKRVKGGKIR
jgi:hypothetical protein